MRCIISATNPLSDDLPNLRQSRTRPQPCRNYQPHHRIVSEADLLPRGQPIRNTMPNARERMPITIFQGSARPLKPVSSTISHAIPRATQAKPGRANSHLRLGAAFSEAGEPVLSEDRSSGMRPAYRESAPQSMHMVHKGNPDRTDVNAIVQAHVNSRS